MDDQDDYNSDNIFYHTRLRTEASSTPIRKRIRVYLLVYVNIKIHFYSYENAVRRYVFQ